MAPRIALEIFPQFVEIFPEAVEIFPEAVEIFPEAVEIFPQSTGSTYDERSCIFLNI